MNAFEGYIVSMALNGQALYEDDEPAEIPENICGNCGTEMGIVEIHYICGLCGNRTDFVAPEARGHSGSAVVVGSGVRRRVYNLPTNNQEAKRRAILEDLKNRGKLAGAPHIPEDILAKVADLYVHAQKNAGNEIHDPETNDIIGETPWVHRGNIKNEILAALVYSVAQSSGVAMKKRTVAKFIGSEKEGFSQGEDIVRKLAGLGVIEINMDNETISGFAERYLEALSLEKEWYVDFVTEVVDYTTLNNWCLNCQLSSRVAGAIWMLIQGASLRNADGHPFTNAQIEKATDGTKKNTFRKIADVVAANPGSFQGIFRKYSVALPVPPKRRGRAGK